MRERNLDLIQITDILAGHSKEFGLSVKRMDLSKVCED